MSSTPPDSPTIPAGRNWEGTDGGKTPSYCVSGGISLPPPGFPWPCLQPHPSFRALALAACSLLPPSAAQSQITLPTHVTQSSLNPFLQGDMHLQTCPICPSNSTFPSAKWLFSAIPLPTPRGRCFHTHPFPPAIPFWNRQYVLREMTSASTPPKPVQR